MVSSDRCPHCGALVLPEEKFCAQCGAQLTPGEESAAAPVAARQAAPVEVAPRETAPKTIMAHPDSIEALKDYCAAKGMPLEKMRFFIDQDYRQPRAFGIYRDGDSVVVYKNKADGSRAVRYQGPDEAYAVNELFQKLLSECHARGIYPDGKPQLTDAQRRAQQRAKRIAIITIVVAVVIAAVITFTMIRQHRSDGYYRYGNDDAYYYRYGDDWYYGGAYDWVEVEDFPYDNYDDYYLGGDYDSGWAVDDFKDSSAWDSIHTSSSSSSNDYDSWDSGGTDWSSDW